VSDKSTGKNEVEVQFFPNEQEGRGIVGRIVFDHLLVETGKMVYDCNDPTGHICPRKGFCDFCEFGVATDKKEQRAADRFKIVFIDKRYQGEMPKADGVHGDTWLCRVEYEKDKENPGIGFMFVTPLKNISRAEREKVQREEKLFAPMLVCGCELVDARRINADLKGLTHLELVALRKRGPRRQLNISGAAFYQAWSFWLEEMIKRKAPKGDFSRISGTREFRCGHCKRVEKVYRSDMRHHENEGAELKLVCEDCFAEQTIPGEAVRGEPASQKDIEDAAAKLSERFQK
jgi:hypothetical protein